MAKEIKKLTQKILRELDAEIIEALKPIMEKHGLEVSMAGGRFDPNTNYTAKVKMQIVTDGGVPADFVKRAPMYGLTADDYGKEIRLNNGKMAKVTSINTRRPKYPISVTTADGKGYKMNAPSVLMQLGRNYTEAMQYR